MIDIRKAANDAEVIIRGYAMNRCDARILRIDQAIFEAEEDLKNGGDAIDAEEAFDELDAEEE